MVLAVDDADHQAGETVEIEEAIVLGMNGTRDHDFDGFANGRDQRILFEEAELVLDECDDLAGLVAVRGHGCEKRFVDDRSEEHTSELQSLMRNSYAVFCVKKKKRRRSYN